MRVEADMHTGCYAWREGCRCVSCILTNVFEYSTLPMWLVLGVQSSATVTASIPCRTLVCMRDLLSLPLRNYVQAKPSMR